MLVKPIAIPIGTMALASLITLDEALSQSLAVVNFRRPGVTFSMTNRRKHITVAKIGIITLLYRAQQHNVGADAAARIHERIVGPIKLRNTPPPLASNDLLSGPLVKEHVSEKFNVCSPAADLSDGRTAPEV
jgi:hypothetical protein